MLGWYMKSNYLKRVAIVLVVGTTVLGTSRLLYAVTVNATMVNTVTVNNSCTVSASGFTTTYDPLNANAAANQDVTASISTSCSLSVPAVITLDQGAHAAAGSTDSTPVRRLSSGGTTPVFLNYSLYKDASRSTTWGNTPATGMPLVGTGSTANSSVYARIPFGQNPNTLGTFTDSVVVTVTY